MCQVYAGLNLPTVQTHRPAGETTNTKENKYALTHIAYISSALVTVTKIHSS